jgi:hypothetical protein
MKTDSFRPIFRHREIDLGVRKPLFESTVLDQRDHVHCCLRAQNHGERCQGRYSLSVTSTRGASACTSSEAIAVSPFAFRHVPPGPRVPCRHRAVRDRAQGFARGSVPRADGHPIDDARVEGGERIDVGC